MREEAADDALFIGQSMPWIDPYKEALAWEALVKAGFASEVEVIRRRGGKPDDVLAQIAEFRRKARAAGITLSTETPAPTSAPVAPTDDKEADEEDLADKAFQEASARALSTLAAGISVLASREAPAPVVNVAAPQVNLPAPVINVSVPEAPPPVVNVAPQFHVKTPPAQVTIAHPAMAVQELERDGETLEIKRIVTNYQ